MQKENPLELLVKVCLRAGVIMLFLGVFTRIWSHYNDVHPAKLEALFGITADAFLRFTDTCLLFAIALALYALVRSRNNQS
jgi:hypothetical protein